MGRRPQSSTHSVVWKNRERSYTLFPYQGTRWIVKGPDGVRFEADSETEAHEKMAVIASQQ